MNDGGKVTRRRIGAALALAIGAVGPGCAGGGSGCAGVTYHEAAVPLPGSVATRAVSLDAAYAARHGLELPTAVAFDLPVEGTRLIEPPDIGGAWVRIEATDPGEDDVGERIDLVGLDVPMGAEAARLESLRAEVHGRLLPSLLEGRPKPLDIGTRELTLGRHRAVAAMGRYTDSDRGLVYVSVIGVFDPRFPRGVAALSTYFPDVSAVKTSGNIGRHGVTATVLGTVRWAEPAGG
jgi:hypothetical protein